MDPKVRTVVFFECVRSPGLGLVLLFVAQNGGVSVKGCQLSPRGPHTIQGLLGYCESTRCNISTCENRVNAKGEF